MIRFLAICLLLAWLSGCSDCDGCCDDADCDFEEAPFYVNNSGVAMDIILVIEKKQSEYIEEDTTYYKFIRTSHKQEIKNNDTLCNYYLERNCSRNRYPWEIHDNWDESSVYFKIEFLSEPKTCLVFDGDKKDNDIRYWGNYRLAEKTSLWRGYYYYITPEHKAMATEENCQSSASE